MAKRPTPPLPTDPVVTLPPLNSGVIAQLVASGPIPPPSADIVTIAPGSVPAVASLNTPPGVPQRVPPTVRPMSTLAAWSLENWFAGGAILQSNEGPHPKPPSVGRFDLALAALFARISYYAGVDQIANDLADALGLDWSRVQLLASPLMTCDLWVLDPNRIVVALPGTTTYAQWAAYATATIRGVSRPWLRPYATAWSGLVTSFELISAALGLTLAPWLPNPESIVICGHSAGGAWAQMFALLESSQPQFAANGDGVNTPVCAVYSFGAPAWLYRVAGSGMPFGLLGHARIHAYGDPVPYITQKISRAYEVGSLGGPVPDGTTSFVADADIGLTNPSAGKKSFLERSGLAAATGNAVELAAVLSQRHSVAMYQRSLAAAAAAARDTPDPEYLALASATAQLDAIDGE